MTDGEGLPVAEATAAAAIRASCGEEVPVTVGVEERCPQLWCASVGGRRAAQEDVIARGDRA